jgi:hypothetical protein
MLQRANSAPLFCEVQTDFDVFGRECRSDLPFIDAVTIPHIHHISALRLRLFSRKMIRNNFDFFWSTTFILEVLSIEYSGAVGSDPLPELPRRALFLVGSGLRSLALYEIIFSCDVITFPNLQEFQFISSDTSAPHPSFTQLTSLLSGTPRVRVLRLLDCLPMAGPDRTRTSQSLALVHLESLIIGGPLSQCNAFFGFIHIPPICSLMITCDAHSNDPIPVIIYNDMLSHVSSFLLRAQRLRCIETLHFLSTRSTLSFS